MMIQKKNFNNKKKNSKKLLSNGQKKKMRNSNIITKSYMENGTLFTNKFQVGTNRNVGKDGID
jgi:hypothetical protein